MEYVALFKSLREKRMSKTTTEPPVYQNLRKTRDRMAGV
jgi:hypothetical protein